MPSWVETDIKEVFNGAVTTGAVGDVDVDVTGWSQLTVAWALLATTTTADLTVNAFVYRTDGTTIQSAGVPPRATVAATSDGTNVGACYQYDVRGLTKMKIRGKNNNVGTKTLVITAYYGTS